MTIQSNKPLKYMGYSIVFQEVPDEVSLAFNISDCPYRCEGCHSKYLWEYNGDNFLLYLEDIIKRYKDFISCLCIMGGDQNMSEIEQALRIAKKYNLNTCIYSGSDSIDMFENVLPLLDYIKIGCYNSELGGLDKKTSNQHMYKLTDGTIKEDITYKFRKNKDE